MTDQWIVIPRWDEFQHRDMARSTVPPWIKNLTRLLSDEEYLKLSGHRRGVLHGLWLEYARTRRQLTDDTASLSRRLALKVTRADLEALNHAGFLIISASKPASEPASLEVEVEEIKDLRPSDEARAFLMDVVVDPKGREHRPYYKTTDSMAHVRSLFGRTIHDEIDLEVELRSGDHGSLNDLQRQSLLDEIRRSAA